MMQTSTKVGLDALLTGGIASYFSLTTSLSSWQTLIVTSPQW